MYLCLSCNIRLCLFCVFDSHRLALCAQSRVILWLKQESLICMFAWFCASRTEWATQPIRPSSCLLYQVPTDAPRLWMTATMWPPWCTKSPCRRLRPHWLLSSWLLWTRWTELLSGTQSELLSPSSLPHLKPTGVQSREISPRNCRGRGWEWIPEGHTREPCEKNKTWNIKNRSAPTWKSSQMNRPVSVTPQTPSLPP